MYESALAPVGDVLTDSFVNAGAPKAGSTRARVERATKNFIAIRVGELTGVRDRCGL